MPQEIARQWFVPGDGIDRHVISADIQRYLGNDATVRPGVGTGDNQGMQGYWIKAYRNLTSAMIADLRADSARWRQEQRQTGTRGSKSPDIASGLTEPDDSIEPYVGSSTYHASSAGRVSQKRAGGDSPNIEGPYGLPPSARERERERERDRIPVDRMQVDPPAPSRGYPAAERRAPYQPDGRSFPSESRGYAPDGRSSYPADTNMSGFGAQPPVTSSYGQEQPRYAPSYQQSSDGAPPGYVRQGNYFVPVSGYEPAPSISTRADQYGAGYPQQPQQGRDPRDARYQQPEYADPRYAYPSPAATVSSVSARDREPVVSPQQPSPYGALPAQQYDQYGGRPAPSNPQSSSGSSRANRASVFGGLSGTSSGDRRRR